MGRGAPFMYFPFLVSYTIEFKKGGEVERVRRSLHVSREIVTSEA